jgi:hypothetical protein
MSLNTETALPAVNMAPRRPAAETPSIMLSPELEAEMIGHDEATVRNPRAVAGGFGAGGGHESLVIDFGSGEVSSIEEMNIELEVDEMLPVVEGQEAAIRPAARPMGRPVVPALPSVKPRRVSEEGPPSTMPPPTRRR